jgi:hypothetical protein
MAEIPIIYCDEAGFTGNYLLDASQRFFVFGSVDVEEQRSQDLLSEAVARFRLQNKKELKGQNLIKHPRGKAAIKWLLEECRQNFHLVYSDKVFATAGKFFEFIFEPLVASHNTFFYKIDFHRFIANVIYYSLKLKKPLAIEAIDNIQSIFNKRDNPTNLIKNQRLNPSLLLDTIFYFCQLNEIAILSQITDLGDKSNLTNRWSLDLSLTSLHVSLMFWGRKHPKVRVICDDSHPLSENKDIITLSGLAAQGSIILNPNLPKYEYEVTEVSFGKSHGHASLQLADLFASSANYALNREDLFWDYLVDNFPENFSDYNLRPETQYIDFNTEQCYRNAVVLLRLIEESEKPEGFSLRPELFRDLILIQNVDLPTLEAAMREKNSKCSKKLSFIYDHRN